MKQSRGKFEKKFDREKLLPAHPCPLGIGLNLPPILPQIERKSRKPESENGWAEMGGCWLGKLKPINIKKAEQRGLRRIFDILARFPASWTC
jgi:hypothetical protein